MLLQWYAHLMSPHLHHVQMERQWTSETVGDSMLRCFHQYVASVCSFSTPAYSCTYPVSQSCGNGKTHAITQIQGKSFSSHQTSGQWRNLSDLSDFNCGMATGAWDEENSNNNTFMTSRKASQYMQNLRQMGYSSRIPHRLPLLTSRNLRLRWGEKTGQKKAFLNKVPGESSWILFNNICMLDTCLCHGNHPILATSVPFIYFR